MSRLSHLAECPCMRTTARSGEVAARTGGMESRWPCGMSTHIRQLMRGQEAQGFVLVAGGHPGPVEELHAHPVWRSPGSAGHDVVLAGPRDGKPRRELQQDHGEL